MAQKAFELLIVIIFALLFTAYAVCVYPFERLYTRWNKDVQAKQLHYAPTPHKS
ncbi:hypothetical protein ACFFGV_01555 [Pontibacillus salicampi]|uniref:Uncharacterized protein n=1 Tax=Pontibacillus salicampi TaxID=1449801 RepID=A0ABV6LIU5_9BACI